MFSWYHNFKLDRGEATILDAISFIYFILFLFFGTKNNKYAKQFLIHHFYFQHPSLWFLALHLQTVCSNVKSTNWLSLSKVLHSVLKGKAIDDSAGNTWSRSTSAFMKPLSSAVSGGKLQFNLIKEEKHQQKNNQSRKFSWEYRGIFIYLLVFKSTAFYAVVVFTLFSRLSHVVTLCRHKHSNV